MIENVVVPVATGYGLAERVCIFEKPSSGILNRFTSPHLLMHIMLSGG